jgi:hypothetical protein
MVPLIPRIYSQMIPFDFLLISYRRLIARCAAGGSLDSSPVIHPPLSPVPPSSRSSDNNLLRARRQGWSYLGTTVQAPQQRSASSAFAQPSGAGVIVSPKVLNTGFHLVY